jgi:hypothetical protein
MRRTSEPGETAQSLTGIGLARRIMTPVPAITSLGDWARPVWKHWMTHWQNNGGRTIFTASVFRIVLPPSSCQIFERKTLLRSQFP